MKHRSFLLYLHFLTCLNCIDIQIDRIQPRSGPISGGTMVSVWGSGFTGGVDRTECYWRGVGDTFGKSSDETKIVNDSYIECPLPPFDQIDNFIQISAGLINLDIEFYISRNSTLSNQFSFTFFNLSKVSVTSLSPLEGVFSQLNPVTFSVINLNYTQELACLLEGVAYPASDFSTDSAICTLPVVSSSRRERVQLSLNGDDAGRISPSPGTSTEFTFYQTAPTIRVTYTPSLTHLFLDFDRRVEIGGRDQFNTSISPNCSLLFTTETLNEVGGNALCSWDNYQQARLVVELTERSSLRGVSSLALSSSQPIRSRYVLYSYLLPPTSHPVAAESTDVFPIAVLHTFTQIPSCGDLAFDALSSQLGGTHLLTASWGLVASSNEVTELNDDFTSQSGLQWSLPASRFNPGVAYSVSLTLTNFLQNSVTESVSLLRTETALPPATVYHSLAGVMYIHSHYTILSAVQLSPCLLLSPSPLNFSWSISNLIIPLSGTNSPILTIPPHFLTSSTQHQVQYSLSNGSLSRDYEFNISVSSSPPLALILGGSRRTHSVEEDLAIDGSASYDPSLLPLSYSWNCTDVITNTVCRDRNNAVFLSRRDLSRYVFPRTLLMPSLLSFTLSVSTMDARVSELAQLTVDIRTSTPDLIYIRPFPYCPLPQVPMAVSGWVRTQHPQAQLAITSLRDVVENGAFYDYAPNLSLPPLLFSPLSPYHLPPDSALLSTSHTQEFTFRVPSLTAGQKYRLSATLTADGTETATAEVDIQMGTPPHFGGLTVTTSLRDRVRIYSMLASEWRDSPAALPLTYRFGISYGGAVHWLTPATTLARIDTPLLCSVNSHLPLLLEVQSRHGGRVQYSSDVAVTAHDDVTGAVEKVKLNLLYGYNVLSGLSIVSSILYYYKTEMVQMPPVTADMLWSHFRTAFWSLLPRDRAFSAHAAFLVAEFVTRAQLITEDQVGEMLHVLDQALDSVNSCPPPDQPFQRGISTELLDRTLIAISRLDISRVPTWCKLPTILSRLAFATRNGFHADLLSLSSGNISLKISHSSPGSLYYAACNARGSDCSDSYPRFVFSQSTFASYNEWDCSSSSCLGHEGFDSVNCSGVTIVTSTLDGSSYHPPSRYSPQVLSSIASISLLHPSNFLELAAGDISITLSLQTHLYSPQDYSCAVWDKNNLTWDTSVCSTLSVSSGTVSCQCRELGTIAVVSTCPPGTYGPTCANVCPHGVWGDECSQSCTCSLNSTCLAPNGSCDCYPGYTGTECDVMCAPWSYGEDCLSSCSCVRDRSIGCDHVDGTCDCKAGFRGDICAITCNRGTWGYRCAHLCTCESTGVCNYLDGTCNCFNGFGGVDCGTSCPAWTFGSNCTGECTCDRDNSAYCRKTDGLCMCNDTYTGVNCGLVLVFVEPSFPIVPIAASVPIILLILIVLLILTLLLLCYRKKTKVRVAISPDKVPLYRRIQPGSVLDRRSPESATIVDYNGIFSTKVDSYVVIPVRGSEATVEEEDCWYFIELVIAEDRESWRPPSHAQGDVPFQAPERPEIGVLSLSGRYSDNSRYDSTFEKFPEPVLLPRQNNTLFDLRTAFVDSGQWSGGPFQFLKKDVAFTFIPIPSEDDVALLELLDTNIYIQQVRDSDSCMLDLCVCGKVSEFECSHCNSRGYCGEDCQTQDWDNHLPMCLKAQNAAHDPSTSLNTTMAGSLEFSALGDSLPVPDRKLGVSAKLEQIGESELEETGVDTPPIPLHSRLRRHSPLPEQEELPLTKSDQEMLDVHPDTDEVVLFDPHESKRRYFQAEREGSLPGSIPEL